ncbi:MAG: type I methionyl aminopeptidase [Actinobacteria bacterium]|nr:type I methionyl aminopeptidase [Actinomycetota bacterium]MBI3686494.1 type I methionyl aminopeptidase [Actinomycetota bacterium]
MVELKSDVELVAMREAGRVVATVLASVQDHARVGTALRELDVVAREVLAGTGARSTFLGYHPAFAPSPFPAVICTSVNDAALHGIPGDYRLRDGDVLSIDCGAEVDGWAGDAAVTVIVGAPRPADARLVDTTQRALAAGIAAAQVGGRLGDISHAIGSHARRAGYGLNVDYGGHGIGRRMHEEPSVPNDGRPKRGMPLRPGLVLAIEPWFMAGGRDSYQVDQDGWTLRTGDASRAAHVEHTVAITESGPRILTLP